MRLNVKQLSGDQFSVDIELDDLVLTLKTKIQGITNVEPSKQRLIFSARELVDSCKLSDYSTLIDGKTVHLVVRRAHFVNSDASSVNPNDNKLTYQDIESQQEPPLLMDDSDGIRIVDVMEMSRCCRLIKIFSLIDCALMIVFAIWDPFFLIGLPLAMCGYIGAKKLHRVPLFIYGIFILLSVAFRVFLAYAYFSWLMVILSVVSVLLECYILRQSIFVFRKIPALSAHDRRLLGDMAGSII